MRELRNSIMGAAVMMNGNEIGADDLVIEDPAIHEALAERDAPRQLATLAAAVAPVAAGQTGGNVNLEELERQAIMRALTQTGQHQERAAHLLGISSRTLSRKLKSYGLGRALTPEPGSVVSAQAAR